MAQIDNVAAVKQARYDDMQPIEGMDLLAGNDDILASVMDMGGTGGILVASHLVGREMRRIIDEPDARQEIEDALRDLYRALTVTTNPIPVKTALQLTGHEVGGFRLPLVDASDEERTVDPRGTRAPQAPGRRSLTPRGTLRILPLGGLGEIGKNMTVVEYDGRIVVVDTGLMFPAPDQLGIDLVLPDFAYLRDRAADIEAIVLTHGHEDHVGALPFVLRELGHTPAIYGGPLTAAMVRSKLDEHRLKDVAVSDVLATQTFDAGPFSVEMVKMAHSIPDSFARGAHVRARHRPRHRRLQVRPDARGRRSRRRLPPGRAGSRGPAAPLRRLHKRGPAGHVAVRVERGAPAAGRLLPL